jgi:hypothetical protein
MSQFYQIVRILSQGEIYVAPILLFLFLIFRKRKMVFGELLISYNYLMFFLIGVYLVNFLFEIYAAWSYTSKYEYDIFFSYRASGPYAWSYWVPLIIEFVLILILLFRRWRLNPWFAFSIFFFIHFNLWMERLIFFLGSFYRDFLPSSWRVSYVFAESVFSIAIFSAFEEKDTLR